jgi:predicted TIM-barrel fold metal-dependent hydrolase
VSTAGIDLDDIVAIDIHTHVHGSVCGDTDSERLRAMNAYFGQQATSTNVHEMAAYYGERKMLAVVFTVDTYTVTGDDPLPGNEEIAELAAEHTDVIIPFASVDPGRRKAGVKMLHRLVTELGMRGLKLHPSAQEFAPNDRSAYPLYEAAQELRIPVLVHTGHTGVGAGEPGGGGIRLKYSNPMLLDDVAVDFPDLTIIMAHPSFPWQDEALSVARHKPNVHIDLSGWSPKYFPDSLVQHANSILQDKVLFGSDYPLITPDRWLADFEKLDMKPAVVPKILKGNAARLLGLDQGGAAA